MMRNRSLLKKTKDQVVAVVVQSLFMFVLTVFHEDSFARSEVTCWDDNCLKNGWTWSNPIAGQKTELACYRDGCENSGWIAQNEYQKYYTQCKDQACFKNGWYRIDQNSQNLIHNVVCRSADSVSLEMDCMKFGWVIYSSQGQEAVISCFCQDCRQKGWLIQTSYELIRVNCKAGGRWQKGWIEN